MMFIVFWTDKIQYTEVLSQGSESSQNIRKSLTKAQYLHRVQYMAALLKQKQIIGD